MMADSQLPLPACSLSHLYHSMCVGSLGLPPYRLDMHVYLAMPTESERVDILSKLLLKMGASPDIDVAPLAARTEGFSGADLQALMYNAQLHVAHDTLDRIEARLENDCQREVKEARQGRRGGGSTSNHVARHRKGNGRNASELESQGEGEAREHLRRIRTTGIRRRAKRGGEMAKDGWEKSNARII
jgi:SpoVK/Ycf46/Vps4 family AAA+-type ATPase